jgi:glycosyltransferase involved in cell wall biosynthesis
MNRPYIGGKIDVSVVIPAHNEEANISPLLEQFSELARRIRFAFEVIIVDDGSTDKTLARLVDAQRVHRFLRVVSIPYRRGLTEALQAGFGIAQGGVIVFYPADRQFHPSDIPRLVDKVREGYDLVTGRKIGAYDKRAVSGLYSRISRWLFPSIPVTDLNSVKAFRREMIDVFDYRHDWHRFWVAIVAEHGYRVAEVDVTLYPRPAGRSKFGFWRIPGGVLDLLAVKFQYHTMRRPLWYFGITGSALLAAAFLIGLWALYQRFILNHGYRPLLYLVMTLGISGVVFFTLGFLAESVAGIRQQVESLRGHTKFRLYHPAPPGTTTVQLVSAPASEARPSRGEIEPRPAPAGDRERAGGRGGPRGQRPPDRRGDLKRRRGPDPRDGRPPIARPLGNQHVPPPVSPDLPVTGAEIHDDLGMLPLAAPPPTIATVPTEVGHDLDYTDGPIGEDRSFEPAHAAREAGTAGEQKTEIDHPHEDQQSAASSESRPADTEPVTPEKRPQYGRRNRP